MLIYRYLNSVIDTSKTEKSITLSITIWGYLSRFSANHYAEVTEFIYEQNPLPMGRKQARHVSVRFKG